MLRLGEPPSPVPTPFAQLLLAWINERDNMNTATNPHSRWLFPGRRARQPIHPTTLAALIHKLGVPTRTAAQPRSASTSGTCQQPSSPTP
ncbi:MAG: hypothetical protein JO115_01460 [Pseudonocardiales bacterium]|nr:hypothetical protein [Pseudonocardiales bacterium]